MAQNKTAVGALVVAIVLTVLARLSLFFFAPEKLGQQTILDNFLLLGSVLLLGVAIFNQKAVLGLFKEYKSTKGIIQSIAIGIAVGLMFAFISVGKDSLIGSITTTLTGGYVSFSVLGDLDPTNKLDQLKLSIVTDSPLKHFFLSLNLNYFIALSEEFLMAAITILLLIAVRRKIVGGSNMELSDSASQVVLVLRGVIFSSLHIFAYTVGLTVFTLAYFIPAIIAGIVFGILFYWRGLLPPVIAHMVYNQSVDVYRATGNWSAILPSLFVVVLLLGVVYYLTREKRKR